MVNSKKMSKSSVAVIVLAILLVISMILGLTGAWFAAKGEAIEGSDGSLNIRDGWMTVSVEAAGTSTLYATRAGEGEEAIPNTEVMPGDWVYVEGDTITVKTTYTSKGGENKVDASKVKAYVYLVELDENDAPKSVAKAQELAAGESFELVIEAEDLTGTGIVKDGDHYVLTGADWDSDKQGAAIGDFAISGYNVYAIQVENMDDQYDAFAQLKADYTELASVTYTNA